MRFRAPATALFLGLASAPAWAATATAPTTTQAGGGQPALSVGFDAAGKLRAAVCSHEPCAVEGGTVVDAPPEVLEHAAQAKFRVVPIGLRRSAVIVETPGPDASRTWTSVVLAPVSGGPPLVPFDGYTGFFEGTEGEQRGAAVVARPEAVYVGVEQQGADLCGRPALLSPTALDPKTLTLKPAKLQRLDESEREHAPSVTATEAQPESLPSILRAAWASSWADGEPPAALTDGKPETRWAEDRSGAGRGEFAVLLAPREVPIEGFSLVVQGPPAEREAAPEASGKDAARQKTAAQKPQAGGDPDAAPPRDFWLVTDHELYRVVLPETAAKAPGTVWQVTLPHPVQTSCVAIALETGAKNTPDTRVGISEIQARATLHGSVADLVEKLAGGPDRAAAAALLEASGPEAARAVADGYAKLDDTGKRLAFDILDEASCDIAIPVYVSALVGSDEAHRLHALSALPRCGAVAAEALARALAEAPREKHPILAEELSELAPEAAIAAIVPLLDGASAVERRAYRSAIRRAASRPAAHDAVVAALSRTDLGVAPSVDLLRAIGPELPAFGDAATRAFDRTSTADSSFRTRFLLLDPAAKLSGSSPSAKNYLEVALTRDESPRVRAEATRFLPAPKAYVAELSTLLGDPEVRVRQAAVTALGTGDVEQATENLLRALSRDEWPLVRRATARALATFSANPRVDRALADSLGDASAEVRAAALASLGLRRAISEAPAVRDRLDDDDEAIPVRAAAALSLGAMCDLGASNLLTKYARLLVDPQATDAGRTLAENAVLSLGMLKPKDLSDRLSPLLSKTAPPAVQRFAGDAVSGRTRCARATAKAR